MRIIFRWLRNRIITRIVFVLTLAAVFISIGFKHELKQAEWASWVQAVGSIAAIFLAFVIGERQAANALTTVREADHLSARRRYDSIIALAESTETFMHAITEAFGDGQFGYLQFRSRYRKEAFDALSDALKVVSAQDLGSYNSIIAWTLLREAVANFQDHMVRVQTFISSQRSENGGISQVLQFDSAGIKLCYSQAQKSVEILRDHRPKFAT